MTGGHSFAVHLFAGEPHEHISHDALPLALEHAFLQSVKQLKVLLDQEPQGAGKRPEDGEKEEKVVKTFSVHTEETRRPTWEHHFKVRLAAG